MRGLVRIEDQLLTVAQAWEVYVRLGELLEHADDTRGAPWRGVRAWLDGHFLGCTTLAVSRPGGHLELAACRRERRGLLMARVGTYEVALLVRHARMWSGYSVRYSPGPLGAPKATPTGRRWRVDRAQVDEMPALAWRGA